MSNWKPRIGIASPTLAIVVLLVACGAPRTTPVAQRGISQAEATTTIPEAQNTNQPAVTHMPYLTYTPYPTSTPLPTATPRAPTPTVISTIPAATEATVPAEAPAALPTPTTSAGASASHIVELRRIPDADPAPPFTIRVDVIRIRENGYYMITGLVRNDGSETYEGIAVHASFFDDKGDRYGPVDVYCPCPFLEPGAECPFSLEMYQRNYEAYHLHPMGEPVLYRHPAPIAVSTLNLSNDGIGNVRITGKVTNENGFTVTNATVAGALADDGGRMVSVGGTIVLGDLLPGASASFDLRIQYEPYAHYQLYAAATH